MLQLSQHRPAMIYYPIMKNRKLRAGDRVRVRFPAAILSTLDADGTLDGVPFMPEMLDWCGKPFLVQRRVEKTCVDGYPMRCFPGDDVVILDGSRCDGQGHDGCRHGCRIFWKEAWLRPADAEDTTAQVSETALRELRARLKVKADANHYFCQSTQLYRSTETFTGKQKVTAARIVFKEIRRGDLSVPEVLRLIVHWSWQKLQRAAGADGSLHGPHKLTPSESLSLKPGEVVRVKSRAQIVATLDQQNRNRGMGICCEMTRCCGREAKVRYRVDRLIDERTGTMRELSDTVVLQNIRNDERLNEECLCYGQLGDCPRGELMYWREIWLERVNRIGAGAEEGATPLPAKHEPAKAFLSRLQIRLMSERRVHR